MSKKPTRHQREALRAQRLQRLINREGNGVKVQFFTVGDPDEDRTPDIDVDATPPEGYADDDDDLPDGWTFEREGQS